MKKIFAALITIFLVIIALLGYYGMFTEIRIEKTKTPERLIVFEKFIGDYKNSGTVMDRVYNKLKNDLKIETTKGFGIYYDNPEKVKPENLRSIVGCIIDNKKPEDLASLPKNMHAVTLPSNEAVTAVFPFKGMPSVIMGAVRVYPKIKTYMAEHKISMAPVMEIYDTPEKKITYNVMIGADQKELLNLLNK